MQFPENPITKNCPAATFKFRSLKSVALWLMFVELFGIAMGLIWIWRDSLLGGLIFLILFCSFFGIVGGISLLAMLDINIDDYEISRSFLGKVWQRISWSNVQKIWVFSLPDYYKSNKPVRSVVIYPIKKQQSRFNLTPNGRIAFRENAENIDQLIKLINKKILEHNIKVEISTDKTTKISAMHI